jgi:hypothetical protein
MPCIMQSSVEVQAVASNPSDADLRGELLAKVYALHALYKRFGRTGVRTRLLLCPGLRQDSDVYPFGPA